MISLFFFYRSHFWLRFFSQRSDSYNLIICSVPVSFLVLFGHLEEYNYHSKKLGRLFVPIEEK